MSGSPVSSNNKGFNFNSGLFFNKEISVTIRKDDENCSPKVTRCVLYE